MLRNVFDSICKWMCVGLMDFSLGKDVSAPGDIVKTCGNGGTPKCCYTIVSDPFLVSYR